jgi:hypothetical protein
LIKHTFIIATLGLGPFACLVPHASRAAGLDLGSCLQKTELKATDYPNSDDEAHAKCTTGTGPCRDTWETLALVKKQVAGDYQALCSHALTPPPATCTDNCLDNAVQTTRQALNDTTTAHDHVVQLGQAVSDGRKQNLQFAAQQIPKHTPIKTTKADPTCWWDWRMALRFGVLLWSERAEAALTQATNALMR